MRQFTEAEWRDLARGQRALAFNAEKALEANAKTSSASHFEQARQHHLELAELCEQWATVADSVVSRECAQPASALPQPVSVSQRRKAASLPRSVRGVSLLDAGEPSTG